MKRNRKLKYSLCAWLTLAAGVLTTTACSDDVESVDFNVRVEGTAVAGSPVTFVFEGNPDYISFFSGEAGEIYANRNRTNVSVESMSISYDMTQRYTTRADFKEPIYFAFRYLAPLHPTNTNGGSGNNTTYRAHPRVDVSSLCLSKVTAEGETILADDMLNDWGFSPVFVNSTSQTNFTVGSTNLTLAPQNDHCDQPVEVWMISQHMDATSVEPDRGEPIKGTNTRVTTYEYTYTEPGTYTATFIATNANMWDSKQTVREVTFEVTDPNATPEEGGEATEG